MVTYGFMNNAGPALRVWRIACCFVLAFFLTASPSLAQQPGERSQITPQQVEQARQALEQGEVSTAEIQKLEEKKALGTLTPEEIEAGKKLLEERQRKAAQPEEKKEETRSEEELTKKPPAPTKPELKIFGHELFSRPPSTFAPITQVPVSNDYIIGPGDEIKVLMWGRIDIQYSLVVNEEGVILFPKVGPLTVAGLTYKELKELIKQKAEAITGVNVNISMGKLRTIQVFVLGEVKSPGVYTISSLATMSNALLASGGPTQLGSLRKVQLKRRGRVVTTIDFYDFLLRGDTSGDARLMPGDVVFVNQVGPLVTVAGNVKRPARYEFREERNLETALNLAGGLAPLAYNQRIQIERAFENRMRIILDIPHRQLKKAEAVPLQDGDVVRIFSILDTNVNAIQLFGNVLRPGQYAYKAGMRVLDLIPNLRSLQPDTYLPYALIKRYMPEEMTAKLMPFNLKKLLITRDLSENLPLQAQDEVYVFNKSLFQEKLEVGITGEVRKPGRYSIDKMTIKDLVYKAGGLRRDADHSLGHLFRTAPRTKNVTLMTFNLEKALEDDAGNNLLLQDQDEVVIHSIRETKPKEMVSIYGMVNNPGEYPLAVGMSIKDLIMAGGNLRKEAYKEQAELVRFELDDGQLMRKEVFNFDVAAAVAGDPQENLILQEYDRIFIKKIPKWLEQIRVNIDGEVRYPGDYYARDDEKLSSLIERAGGFTKNAYLRGAFFTRESVRQIQRQRLEDLISRMEEEISAETGIEATGAMSKEEVEAFRLSLEAKKGLLQKLRQARVTGRMVIQLSALEVFKDSKFDLRLEDGDKLLIPKEPENVNVLGEVYNPTAFLFERGKRTNFYLGRAGGPTANAEKGEMYIVRADGSVLSKSQGGSSYSWDPETNRWVSGSFSSAQIYPGDSVLVPRKLVRIHWIKEAKDITQILFQIAVVVGVMAAI